MFFCSSTDGRVLCIDRQSGICSRHVCIECHVPEKYLGHKNDFVNGYGKPLAAAAGMGVVAWIVYYGLHLLVPIRIVCLGVSVILAALVYLILYVIVTKTTVEQMRRFPMGNYVVKVLRILKVFR